MPSSIRYRIGLLTATSIVLTLLFCEALFLRSAPFTPDEPREFDLAWNMMQQADKAVPLLAGEPFCEKPPLTYWTAAASMGLFGATLWAARLPNLLWTALTVFCVVGWIRTVTTGAQKERASVFGALVACSALLLFRVQIWFATDAPLVAATSLALFGGWKGFNAQTTRDRLRGYLLFHLGLAAAFFAKNLLGWVVPIGAFLGIVIWERRWRELLRYELYVGLGAQLILVLPWIAAVAHRPDGSRLLKIFLLDNTFGRLLPIDTEDQYQLGHRNHPGKYLAELPYYLLPWTFAVVAAIRWTWKRLRAHQTTTALRFAVLTIVPGFALLSLSKTARDVYFAPELLGFAMLLGMWFGSVEPNGHGEHTKFDRICLSLTTYTAFLVGGILILASFGAPLLQGFHFPGSSWVIGLVTVAAIFWLVARLRAEWPMLKNVTTGWGIYALGVGAIATFLFPTFDASQDLRPAARAVAEQFGSRPIATLREDETMRAYLEFGGGIAADNMRSLDDAVAWLNADSRRVLLVELSTDHVTPAARQTLASWNQSWRNLSPVDANSSALELQKRGLHLLWQYTVIGGRTYGVLGASKANPTSRQP